MGVSKNRGTPKWMVYNGKPYQNGWFGGTPIFGNTHIISYPWLQFPSGAPSLLSVLIIYSVAPAKKQPSMPQFRSPQHDLRVSPRTEKKKKTSSPELAICDRLNGFLLTPWDIQVVSGYPRHAMFSPQEIACLIRRVTIKGQWWASYPHNQASHFPGGKNTAWGWVPEITKPSGLLHVWWNHEVLNIGI